MPYLREEEGLLGARHADRRESCGDDLEGLHGHVIPCLLCYLLLYENLKGKIKRENQKQRNEGAPTRRLEQLRSLQRLALL